MLIFCCEQKGNQTVTLSCPSILSLPLCGLTWYLLLWDKYQWALTKPLCSSHNPSFLPFWWSPAVSARSHHTHALCASETHCSSSAGKPVPEGHHLLLGWCLLCHFKAASRAGVSGRAWATGLAEFLAVGSLSWYLKVSSATYKILDLYFILI